MDSIGISLDENSFAGLLSALTHKLFHSRSPPEVDTILEQFYAQKNPQDSANEVDVFESILKKGAEDSWTGEKLGQFLLKRQFPAKHTEIFVAFWDDEFPNIKKSMVHRSTFNRTLKNLRWRVDVQVMSDTVEQINEPQAHFEMDLQERSGVQHTAKFSMDKSEVQAMVEQLQNIDKVFTKLAGK